MEEFNLFIQNTQKRFLCFAQPNDTDNHGGCIKHLIGRFDIRWVYIW